MILGKVLPEEVTQKWKELQGVEGTQMEMGRGVVGLDSCRKRKGQGGKPSDIMDSERSQEIEELVVAGMSSLEAEKIKDNNSEAGSSGPWLYLKKLQWCPEDHRC